MCKEEIARQLEELVSKRGAIDVNVVASWAYRARLQSLDDLNREVLDVLEELGSMDMGPEFEWSKAELETLVTELRQ